MSTIADGPIAETETGLPPHRRLLRFFRKSWRGEIVPRSPLTPDSKPARRVFLMISLGIVVGAILLLELTYSSWPVPPGVDSGDWIQRSFGWVDLAHPPMDAVGSPFLYNPLTFPVLGATVLVTGSPLATGFVFGGLLLVLYGLSVVHLSRRFLLAGPFQVLFVGLAVLNGTTLQILFWGGYPNFLAFVFFNEALVFLLAFARSRSAQDGLLLYGMASLLFLTHDLTFVMFFAALGTTTLFLLFEDRRWWGVVFSRPNLVGLAILGVTVVGYIEITSHLGIVHPGYFSSNPAAYAVDNIGQVFHPLGTAPLLLPMGPGIFLTPLQAILVLGIAGLAPVALLAFLRIRRRRGIETRHFIGVAVFVAACIPPVAGYLIHVDTDYTRFAYFFGLPVALLLSLGVESLIGPRLRLSGQPDQKGRIAPGPASSVRRNPVARETWALAGVSIVLVLLLTNVTIPVAITNEQSNAGTTHDALFLQMTQWLAANPEKGSVITTQGAVRWVEALTDRGAFDVGPTWLLFEPWQILNAEECYWAINSQYALTNNLQVFSFSGFNGSIPSGLLGAPLYGAYVEGVQFPFLRLVPSSTDVFASTGGSATPYALEGSATPLLSISSSSTPAATVVYPDGLFSASESTALSPGGIAWMNLTVTPGPGVQIDGLNLTLSSPSLGPALLHAPTSQGVSLSGSGVVWNDSAILGQLPGAVPFSTQISASLAASITLSSPGASDAVSWNFTNPQPGSPFDVSISLQTSGLSNPATSLPTLMLGSEFLSQHDIHFLVLPNQAGFTGTAQFFEAVYGFSQVYSNPEWTVLQR